MLDNQSFQTQAQSGKLLSKLQEHTLKYFWLLTLEL